MVSEFDVKAKDWDTADKIERAKNVAIAIKKQVSLSRNMSAFEYGCGTGLLSFELQKEFKSILLADTSEGMLEVLNKKIKKAGVKNMTSVKHDLTHENLPTKKFDIVYSMMALHHIKDTENILQKLSGLLNHEGKLCIADLDTEDGSFHGKEVTDVHLGFDRKELGKLAEKSGFKNVHFSTADKMDHVNPHGEKGKFTVFLMTAEKK